MFPTHTQRGVPLAGLLLAVMLFGHTDILAQAPANPVVETQPTDEATAQAQREQGRKRAYAGLMAVVGIAIAGVALLAVTILWGGRLRRENRKPLPTAELKDELWFLRTKSGRTAADEPADTEPAAGE